MLLLEWFIDFMNFSLKILSFGNIVFFIEIKIKCFFLWIFKYLKIRMMVLRSYGIFMFFMKEIKSVVYISFRYLFLFLYSILDIRKWKKMGFNLLVFGILGLFLKLDYLIR